MLVIRTSTYKFGEGNPIQPITVCPLAPKSSCAFLTCKIHSTSHPNIPQILNPFQHQPLFQNLIQMSSKSDMHETQDIIHPEPEFLTICEPVEPGNKSSASEM